MDVTNAKKQAPKLLTEQREDLERLLNRFHIPALKQLANQQVRFSPPSRRQEQLVRAEKLLTEIDLNRQYPYQFICYRITEFRPDSHPDLLIDGHELEHDLCLFIEALSQFTPAVPIEAVPEPVLTLEEVSKRLNVSTKTISRWRQKGLVGGRRIMRDGRRQVGFAQSVVDRFVSANPDLVERSSRFSQVSDDEREDILRRARRLARVGGGSLTEVSRRIARRLGRSAETIRCTIKNFDRQNPQQALFPQITGPLDAETRQAIYSSYERDIPVETLAKRFQRTRTSIYRVIGAVRAQRLLDQPLDFIPHPDFEKPELEAEILAPMPGAGEYEARRRQMTAPRDVPPELAPLYEVPLLNKEQEQHLFRKMNFLKCKALRLRDRFTRDGKEVDPAKVRIHDLDQIDELLRQATAVKDQLINANMRLVVSIAKKHSGQTDNFFELLSDGNMSLIRAVEKFDCARGFKFSTYASWAIMKNFARSIPEERHRRERYVTGHDDLFEAAPDTRTDEQECLASAEQAAYRVNRLLENLDPRERDIIRMRAGLDEDRPMTLEEIGQQLGITKERVRQLNVRIMKKLRDIAHDQELDL
jgi:RNA polymerase sigma factor (sigma-70 family)